MFFAATPDRPEGEIVPSDVFGAHCDVFGPNLAVRRAAIDDQAMFNRGFFAGPHGLMGEDTDFVRRLAARGYKVGFTPRARVRHIVLPEQTTWRWILRRCYRHGRFSFVMANLTYVGEASPAPKFPRWRIRRVITAALTLPIIALGFNKRRLFVHLKRIAYDLGALDQAKVANPGFAAS